MSKKKTKRVLAANEAKAFNKVIRTGTRKLNLVAESIRGLKVDTALAELTFSKKRIAGTVKEVLKSAVANAENNHNLDVDRLYVAEAFVGKNITMKRWRARARGRTARILKPFSNLTIIVREHEEKA